MKTKKSKPAKIPTPAQSTLIPAQELFSDLLREAVNAAEVKVANALEALEKKGWIVLSNFSFHTLSDTKSKRGEADFVLLGPQGLLILECKGGLVKWQSSNMKVLLQQATNQKDKQIDPWFQSQKAAAFLQQCAVEFFKQQGQKVWINWGYAAIFPDAELHVQTWTGSATDRLFLDRRDLPRLSAKIEEILTLFNNKSDHINSTSISREMWLNFIERGLSTQVNFKVFGHEYRKQALISRKQSQEHLAHFLPALLAGVPLPRVQIEGGAGTGKTLLLIERAVEACRKHEHVLVVCYNQPLKEYLFQSLKIRGAGCLVLSIHDLAEKLLVGAGINLDIPTNQEDLNLWYGHTIFEKVLELLGPDFKGFFDSILVDEAQDFHSKEWWDFLKILHKNPLEGDWLISWDPCQSIYADVSLLPQESPIERAQRIQSYMPQNLLKWQLNVNLRNSAGIYKVLQQMSPNPGSSAFSDDLQDSFIVHKIKSASTNQYKEAFLSILEQAQQEFQLEPNRIVVLGPKRFEHMPLGHQSNWNFNGITYKAAESETPASDELYYYTAYRFKGLESDGVILMGFDDPSERQKLLKWLALSRARLICWSIEL